MLGVEPYAIDPEMIASTAAQVRRVCALGVEVAIVGMIADAALEGRGISGAEGLTYEEMLDVPPAVDEPVDEAEDFSATGTGDGAGQLTGTQGMTPGGATGS